VLNTPWARASQPGEEEGGSGNLVSAAVCEGRIRRSVVVFGKVEIQRAEERREMRCMLDFLFTK